MVKNDLKQNYFHWDVPFRMVSVGWINYSHIDWISTTECRYFRYTHFCTVNTHYHSFCRQFYIVIGMCTLFSDVQDWTFNYKTNDFDV